MGEVHQLQPALAQEEQLVWFPQLAPGGGGTGQTATAVFPPPVQVPLVMQPDPATFWHQVHPMPWHDEQSKEAAQPVNVEQFVTALRPPPQPPVPGWQALDVVPWHHVQAPAFWHSVQLVAARH